MKILGRLLVAGLVLFALMQLLRPGIPSRPATADVQAPPEVKRILEKDCYSCHSDQRRLSWFDQQCCRVTGDLAVSAAQMERDHNVRRSKIANHGDTLRKPHSHGGSANAWCGSLEWASVSNGRGAGTRNMGAARRPALVRWTHSQHAGIRRVRAGGGYRADHQLSALRGQRCC